MNDLIRFRPGKLHRRSGPGDRSAQILFFTGVRYHRMGEEGFAPTPHEPCSARRNGKGGGGAGGGDRTRRR
jgi:hypothetical protein